MERKRFHRESTIAVFSAKPLCGSCCASCVRRDVSHAFLPMLHQLTALTTERFHVFDLLANLSTLSHFPPHLHSIPTFSPLSMFLIHAAPLQAQIADSTFGGSLPWPALPATSVPPHLLLPLILPHSLSSPMAGPSQRGSHPHSLPVRRPHPSPHQQAPPPRPRVGQLLRPLLPAGHARGPHVHHTAERGHVAAVRGRGGEGSGAEGRGGGMSI